MAREICEAPAIGSEDCQAPHCPPSMHEDCQWPDCAVQLRRDDEEGL